MCDEASYPKNELLFEDQPQDALSGECLFLQTLSAAAFLQH